MYYRVLHSLSFSIFFLVCSVFTVNAQVPVNDDQANAIVLTNFDNWISADEAYTTINATNDAPTTSHGDVWFKFTADTTVMDVKVFTARSWGTISLPWLHIYDSQLNEISNKRASWYGVPNVAQLLTGLSTGQDYYIVVSSQNAGTFSLYLNNDITYDWVEGAIDITDSTGFSPDAFYTTDLASQDGPLPLDNDSYLDNVWFKFVADNNEMEFKVMSGGAKGNGRLWYVRLFDENLNLIQERRTHWYDTYITGVGYDSLEVGKTYYTSMTNYVPYSTFTTFFQQSLTNDFQIGAIDIPHSNDWASSDSAYTTFNYSPDRPRPAGLNSRQYLHDAWFKFTAATNEMDLELKTGGQFGTMSQPRIDFYDSNLNLIESDEAMIIRDDLVVDSVYYFTVSARYGTGSFSLSLDTETNTPDNDDWQDAVILPQSLLTSNDSLISTNLGATDDGPTTSKNVWYQFTATTNQVEAKVIRGVDWGTIISPDLHIYDQNLTLLGSALPKPGFAAANVGARATGLTVGAPYYIMVGSTSANYGTFSLFLNEQISNDFTEGAIPLSHTGPLYSANGKYSTYFQTSSTPKGGQLDVWFKFEATTSEAEVKMFRGGDRGGMQLMYLELYDSNFALINSKRSIWYGNPATGISANTLTIGNTYYIRSYGYYESNNFTLFLNNELTNDFPEGAIEITNLSNWYSANAAYSNVDYTAGPTGAKWEDQNDSWFKFIAQSADLEARLLLGGAQGTMTNPKFYLYDDELNQLVQETNEISRNDLVIGDTYYLAVSARYKAHEGSFSLYLNSDSSPQDFYAIADGDWDDPAIWSTIDGGPAINLVPTSENRVFINGHVVTVNAYQESGQISLSSGSGAKLVVDGNAAHLKVFGQVIIDGSSGVQLGKTLEVKNSGRLNVEE